MLYYGKFEKLQENTLEKLSFVIKPLAECSAKGIYIVQYNLTLNNYTELFSKKTYFKLNELFTILNEYYKGKSCFVEEYIENTINGKNCAGIDYKVCCYNGIPKQLNVYSRGSHSQIQVNMYSLITLKEIDFNEYNIKNPFGVKSNLPELKLSKLELIDLVKFSNSLLNKINFKKSETKISIRRVYFNIRTTLLSTNKCKIS